jgi:hypothetical protein
MATSWEVKGSVFVFDIHIVCEGGLLLSALLMVITDESGTSSGCYLCSNTQDVRTASAHDCCAKVCATWLRGVQSLGDFWSGPLDHGMVPDTHRQVQAALMFPRRVLRSVKVYVVHMRADTVDDFGDTMVAVVICSVQALAVAASW